MPSSDKDDKKPARQTVISDQDVELMALIGKGKLPTYIIAAELGITLGNAHNKLTRMRAKGFLIDKESDDNRRAGLYPGEKRRVWIVSKLGRDARDLHHRVMEAQNKLLEEQGESGSASTVIRKTSKRHS